MAKLMRIYKADDNSYYTKSEATEVLKISYRTFEKYFEGVENITTVGGKTMIFKGSDLNKKIDKLAKEKIFEKCDEKEWDN